MSQAQEDKPWISFLTRGILKVRLVVKGRMVGSVGWGWKAEAEVVKSS